MTGTRTSQSFCAATRHPIGCNTVDHRSAHRSSDISGGDRAARVSSHGVNGTFVSGGGINDDEIRTRTKGQAGGAATVAAADVDALVVEEGFDVS